MYTNIDVVKNYLKRNTDKLGEYLESLGFENLTITETSIMCAEDFWVDATIVIYAKTLKYKDGDEDGTGDIFDLISITKGIELRQALIKAYTMFKLTPTAKPKAKVETDDFDDLFPALPDEDDSYLFGY